MKFIKIDESSRNLIVSEMDEPAPGARDLLIQVKAAGVNRCDLMQRKGEYKVPESNNPILGIEVAGVVAAVGPQVKKSKIGDAVFGYVNGGGYAEYCLMDEEFAIALPKDWSFVQGAAVAEVFQTANEALFTHGHLKKGETVFLHSAASGVGTAAIQMAKVHHAVVIASTSSKEKVDFCKNLGADFVLNYKEDNFVQKVKEWTNGVGANLLIDSVGGSIFQDNLRALAIDGRMIALGLLGGSLCEFDLAYFIAKRLALKGHNTRARSLDEQRKISNRLKKDWMPLLENGDIKPIVDKAFSFEEAALAHAYMEENRNIGKIIIQFP